jgi:16S rRNA (uracil1498-N3)-methyltransferase
VGGGRPDVITVLLPPGVREAGEHVLLPAEEVRHLQVRRSAAGVRVRFSDGMGHSGAGVLEQRGREAVLQVELVEQAAAPPVLVLAVGAGDRDRFGWVVEKAAELGATDVVPLETERTAGVATRVREAHVEKLARRAREAIKQCGAAWAPRVLPPVRFEAFVDAPRPGARWLMREAGGTPGLVDPAAPITALVGPEGGFTADEHRLALEAGYEPVRAGPHMLRFETAAVAAAVLAQATRGY